MKLIVLRPQPEAAATASRAVAAGLEVIVSPLFAGRALAWGPPDPGDFDAFLLTSANAVRYAGAALASYLHLPVHAVGEVTAKVARQAGFGNVTAGAGDVAALLAGVLEGPHRSLLHLCGAHRRAVAAAGLQVRAVPVYAMEAAAELAPEARDAFRTGAAAMAHSPRAARTLGGLMDAAGIVRSGVSIIAISEAAADAAGSGWREVVAAPAPTDAAMLAIARRLCDRSAS